MIHQWQLRGPWRMFRLTISWRLMLPTSSVPARFNFSTSFIVFSFWVSQISTFSSFFSVHVHLGRCRCLCCFAFCFCWVFGLLVPITISNDSNLFLLGLCLWWVKNHSYWLLPGFVLYESIVVQIFWWINILN